jgi:NADPH:quinone reductase-like Zn-dependent oxidoreductase
METMKAVRIHTYGGTEVLNYEDAPRPEPNSDEVLIRVYAAGVNPVDWKIREGYLKDMLNHSLPLTLGWDVSGVVVQVGSDVSEVKIGDEVYARPNISRDGAYAEYVVVRAIEVAHKPNSLDHIEAAAIPLAGLTAWQALFDAAQLDAGQTVLIHGNLLDGRVLISLPLHPSVMPVFYET